MSSFNEKVSRMFGDRFGTQLVIKWSDALTFNKESLQDWQTTFVYSRTRRQVSFPIFNKRNELQAIAIASPVSNNDAIRFQEMSQFLQLTVSENLKLRERMDLVAQSEEAFVKTHNNNSNVIRWPLSKNKSRPPKKPAVSGEVKKTYSFEPIWLFGDDHQLNLKVAYAAHEWMRNWAFINVQEIPDLFWQRHDSWLSYAQMTILIPEVESLSEEQWEILEENCREIADSHGPKPLILLTSKKSPKQVKPHLEPLFKVYHTNVNLTPKAQAHFLLYQEPRKQGWIHHCQQMKGLFFLPFGTTSDLLH